MPRNADEQWLFDQRFGERHKETIDAPLAVEGCVNAVKDMSGEFDLTYQGLLEVFLDFNADEICRDVILAVMDPDNNKEAVDRARAWMADRVIESVEQYWEAQGVDTAVEGRGSIGRPPMLEGEMNIDQERKSFEEHFSRPPFSWVMRRHGKGSAWPGDYQSYYHQVAWEAWQARAAPQPANPAVKESGENFNSGGTKLKPLYTKETQA